MSQAAALTDDTARLSVLDALQGGGAVTVADVVARTGLPPYQAEAQLNAIVRDYESDLDVDADGQLVYRFPAGLQGREDVVKRDASRRRKESLRQGFIAFFKAWTVAMVIIYFVLYVILIVAALAALANRSRDNDSRSSSRSGGGGMFWLWWGMGSPWGYGGYGTSTSYRVRRRFNRDVDKRLQAGEDPYALDDRHELKKPSLSERTWYYLFGTRGIKRNPLEQEKELLTYLRAKKGFISNADIIALLGVSYDEADAIGTRLVATYDGEMDLTDEGLAIYRFPNLMVSGAPEVASQVPELGYLWQVRKKEEALRAHPAVVVPILNFVNIILSFVILLWAMPTLGISGLGATLGLFVMPLAFSLTFWGLAQARKARERREATSYARQSMRIAIFRLLFTRRTAVKLPGDERTLNAQGFGQWSTTELAQAAGDIAADLRGEVVAEAGGLRLRVDRVWAEMSAVEKLRIRALSAQPVGRTVFSARGTLATGGPSGPAGAGTGDQGLEAEIAALEKELAE